MELPVGGQPIHRLLVPLSIVCFAGAFVTDFVYWQSFAVIWETFSDLAAHSRYDHRRPCDHSFADIVRGKQIRALAWPHAVGYVLAVLLSLVNAFVHSRDGYTAVVPTGLMLSGLVVVILLLVGWLGSRDRTGAAI